MSIHVEFLAPGMEEAYESLLSSETALLYASLKYRDFLRRVLSASCDRYLVAFLGEKMVGVIPAFVKYNSLGNVLNSLPFYGSYGGVTLAPGIEDGEGVKRVLLDAFYQVAQEEKAVATTIVSSPLEDAEFYETHAAYSLRDERIGQLMRLPQGAGVAADTLMNLFHRKTRNHVRKAQKSGLLVLHSDSLEILRALADLHKENMEAIGVPPKGWDVFLALRESFTYDKDYRVYYALQEEQIIGALLVFFYNRTAEYFIPATSAAHRTLQPMNLLVFEAMQEAVARKLQYWNWGGTALTATGVYEFKKRWGTDDHPYYYFTRIFDERILTFEKETLQQEYPLFYVAPFGSLINAAA